MKNSNMLHLPVVLLASGIIPAFTAFAQTTSWPSRQDTSGQVTVSVTPTDLSDNNAWRFSVQLNTHVAPISQDLVAVSVLSDGKGHDEKPTAWQGDPPGGHHRKGVLLFKPMTPRPESLTLTIRQVGSASERTFTWKLGNP
ncbi:MAG: hypothetical protein GC182_05370 [Rhodopseudomonas sp.]|nr:hypothetical protein [Rhodopseudomonas sp.]